MVPFTYLEVSITDYDQIDIGREQYLFVKVKYTLSSDCNGPNSFYFVNVWATSLKHLQNTPHLASYVNQTYFTISNRVLC